MAKPVASEKKFAVSPIRDWMLKNVSRFVDGATGEVDCTKMVETWDQEVWDGELTFGEEGSRHVAWDVAIEVSDYWTSRSAVAS